MSNKFIARTHVLGPTATKGTRVVVRWYNNRRVIPVDYSWQTDNIQRESVQALFGPLSTVEWGGMDGHYIVTDEETL